MAMTNTARGPLAVLLGLVLGACGGGSSPSASSAVLAPAPEPRFQDGWTEQSVAADIEPPSPRVGVPVTVRAPGYLTREAQFDGTSFHLWPQDESYVTALVYSEFVPGHKLARWASGFTISGSDDPAVANAAREMEQATGLPVAASGGNGGVVIVVDPDDPAFSANPRAIAVTHNMFRGSEIVSSRVAVRDADVIAGVVLHELGHVLGLGHSPYEDDVMFPVANYMQVFSERERVTLRLMYRWRKAGNSAPDRDPGPAAAARPLREITIVD
jgi:Matrixin